jgi:hypothetical protein
MLQRSYADQELVGLQHVGVLSAHDVPSVMLTGGVAQFQSVFPQFCGAKLFVKHAPVDCGHVPYFTPVGKAAGIHWDTLPVEAQVEHPAVVSAVQVLLVGPAAIADSVSITSEIVIKTLARITTAPGRLSLLDLKVLSLSFAKAKLDAQTKMTELQGRISPPSRVPSARHTAGLVDELNQRADPSDRSALTPAG